VDRLLTYNRWFKEQVQVGLDQIERGEIVSHEEVGERVERLFRA
jgi:predicted transcriptional regulator